MSEIKNINRDVSNVILVHKMPFRNYSIQSNSVSTRDSKAEAGKILLWCDASCIILSDVRVIKACSTFERLCVHMCFIYEFVFD